MINTINILIKAHLTFIAEIIMNLISYIYGNKCKFKHKNNFWILSDPKYSNYINFFTDPRINLQNDVLNLLRDVFFYKDTPKINDIVVSVGAGLGHEILVLNESMNNTGKILCIEALPVLIPGLNLTINCNNYSNCKVFNYAIGRDDNAFLTLSNSSENHLMRSVYIDSSDNKIDVPTITMDTFCKNEKLDVIDHLFVNIEGSELDLIKNFKSIGIVRNISISCHDFLFDRDSSLDPNIFCTFNKVKDWLITNNFEIYTRNSGVDYKDYYLYGINKSL